MVNLVLLQMEGQTSLVPQMGIQPLTLATLDTGSLEVQEAHVCPLGTGQREHLLVYVSILLYRLCMQCELWPGSNL